MFKKIAKIAVVNVLCLSMLFAAEPTIAKKAKKPKLSTKSVSVYTKKTKTIKLKNVTKKNLKKAKVTWKISKKKIAKLTKKKKNYCKIKGVSVGKTTLKCTVKIGKKKTKLSCKINVKKMRPVVSIKNSYNGVFNYMGAAVNYGSGLNRGSLKVQKELDFIKKHFSSFTLENEMKPDNILGPAPEKLTVSQAKKKGYFIPKNYTEKYVPDLNFAEVDGALNVAASNGLKMRAHTLVWHSQTPSWFFTKDYDNDTKVSTAVMDARLEFYIHNVMAHVMDKEKALKQKAGTIVYAWDVVNEYLHRVSFGKTWDTVYGNKGASPKYVKKAFEIAYDMLKSYGVTEDVTLVYNDYNTYFSPETTDLLNLVAFINKDEPEKICRTIGMQSHVDIKVPTVEQYTTALKKFLDAGYEVQITELDFTINYDTDNKTYAYREEGETNTDQKNYVKNFMEEVVKIQKNRDLTKSPKGITSVTLWGLIDDTSWRRDCKPLLFGSSISDPKPSFYAFIDAAKAK